MKKIIAAAFFLITGMSSQTFSADKLKDFRGTNQSLALVGVSSEFVDNVTEEKILEDLRKRFNRYSKSYGRNSIEAFKIGSNPGKQFFKPVGDNAPEQQKKFLKDTCKDNTVDVLVIGTLRQMGEETEAELQLYDSRIEAFSKPEKGHFKATGEMSAMDDLVYRLMNYMDREGYVYNTPQDFLTPPTTLQASAKKSFPTGLGMDDNSLNPADLASGNLAGEISTGGEKTPFWEKWWFWTLIGGSLATAGSLTYYFVVVDQPPSNANIGFQMP
ncbi:MAG: hypothetical protein JWQ35_1906 [Bacteriovoracaceae bacterium]|nr:hypothetical protein [Bacteriovoracaceae bacterium]